MRRMILLLAVISSFFMSEGTSRGLTLEQAITEIDQQFDQGKLLPKEYAMAISAMERLTTIGVSVDSAYQLVMTSMSHNIRAKKLAPIVRVIELDVPTTGPIVTEIATTAINNNYGYEEVGKIIGSVHIGAKAGAGRDIPAEIVQRAVEKGVDVVDIRYIAEGFAEDIGNGLSPEEAKENAIKDINNLNATKGRGK